MAGSYKHCVADDGSFWFDLIENMGDAHEACEDMFNVIKALKAKVERLKAFEAAVVAYAAATRGVCGDDVRGYDAAWRDLVLADDAMLALVPKGPTP